MNNTRITNLGYPISAQDPATKAYVDSVSQGLDVKNSCKVATTGNITISTDLNVGDTIDGIVLSEGDRVLVKNQTDASENGIYKAGSSPARSEDFSGNSVTSGAFTFIEQGR